LETTTRGKGKKGAAAVDRKAILCLLQTEDGDEYAVRAGTSGKVVEVNARLVEEPDLVRTSPQSDGFVAILLLRLKEGAEDVKRTLLSEEDYLEEVQTEKA